MKRIIHIKEAFRSGYAPTAVEKIANILGRRIGKSMYPSYLPKEYQNSYGKFAGYYIMVGNGERAVRINFLLGQSDYVSSVDIFTGISAIPSLTIEFQKSDNIVSVIDTTESALLGELTEGVRMGEAGRKSFALEVVTKWVEDDPDNLEAIQTQRISTLYPQFETWVENVGERPVSQSSFINQVKTYMNEKGIGNRYSHAGLKKKGVSESPLTDKKQANEWEQKFKMTVEERFDQINAFVDLLTNNWANGVIITGAAGIGKTYTVLERLNNIGLKYKYTSGGVKDAKSLYKYLYAHRDGEILVMDDIDDVLLNKTGQNILKAVLDRNTQKPNVVTYLDKEFMTPRPKVPSSFEFTSGIIFISNLPRKKFNQAVISRSLNVDLDLSKEEILQRIKEKLADFPPYYEEGAKISEGEFLERKKEVLSFLMRNAKEINRIDFRSFEQAVVMRLTGAPNWKKWVVTALNAL